MIKSPRSGMILNVTSVEQAFELLGQCWTKRCGPKHANALEICTKALKSQLPVYEARLAFMEAAQEIDALVIESTRSTTPPRTVRNKVNDSAFTDNGDRPPRQRQG
ncbi:DUF982 domain-containing protein [Phyllobacterium sp. 2063]|nr:DUF982 domain-containing protein [Phyllobacterium sp. 2063]